MKKTLLNSLLVAVGLLAGTMGAMAEDTYTEVYSRTTTFGASNIWTDNDKAEWGGDTNLSVDVQTSADDATSRHGLLFNTTKPGSSYSATKTFTIADNSKIKYEINWYVGSSTNKPSNYEYIQLGDKIRLSYNSSYNFYLNTDGTSSTDDALFYNKGTQTYPIVIIFNTATNKVESFTFNGTDYTSKVADVSEGSFNKITFGFQRGTSTANWAIYNGLETITVSECAQTVTEASYTINYTYNNSVVATTTETSVVGNEVKAKSVVYDSENNRYLVVADEVPSITLTSGENVLTVPVRKPYTATLNVTTTIDQTSTTATTNLVEADDKSTNWSYAYSLYVAKDGVYYIADNTETFGETGTFTDGQVIDKTVTYSNVAKDVVYFSEGESSVGSNITYSNGGTGYVAAQNKRNRGISAGTLSAGTYEFAGVITGTHGRAVVVREKTSDDDAANSEIFATLSSSTQSATFTLENATDVVISGANSGTAKTNQSEDFDYVVIKRVLVDETLAITSAGYATFVPNANVTIPAAVKAYTVKVNDDNATITLDEIAADAVVKGGTAILVEGAEGSYNFAETTATETTLAENDLVAADGTEVADGTQYGLAQVEGKVGFHKIKSGDTLTKGKAYLKVSAENAAKMSFFSLNGGELTAISGVEAAKAANGEFYTLQGVRVAKPSKGLYICNGKKVIVK